MTAVSRAQQRAHDTCHWCPHLWVIAVDTDIRTWKACIDHLELLPPWDVETTEMPQEATGTTVVQQALRRLEKERPDLLDRVLAEELSPHAAMVQAGFRPRTITVPIDPHRAAAAIRRHFDPDAIDILIKELDQ